MSDDKFVIIFSIYVILIFVIVSISPKFIKKLYRLWLIALIVIIQITCNNLNDDKEFQTKVFKGVDKANNSITCKVQMLNDKFSWKLKDENTVQMNGENIKIEDYLKSDELINELEHSEIVLCIGSSSHEGIFEEEELRATKRSNNFKNWISQILPNKKQDIYALDLGVNQKNKSESSGQRRLIIISVLAIDKEVNFKEALYNGLISNNVIPLNIQEYSKFDIK